MGRDMNSMLTGLSSSLNAYLGMSIKNNIEQQQQANKSQLETAKDKEVAAYKSGLDTTKANTEAKYKNNLEDVLTPDMAEKALPNAGAKLVNDYNTAHPDNPLKLKEGVSYLKMAIDNLNGKNEKQQKSDDVRMTQYARLLSSDREFTTSRTKRDNLENVGALIGQVSSQPDGPDKRQLYEQAVAQMRVLAGNGQISEKEISELVPHTWRGTAAKFLEYIGNKPEGTEAQDFIKRSKDFFERESKVTTDQMSRRVNELSAPYKQILERNPDVATETFQQYKVNHPKYNPAAPEAKKEAPKANGATTETKGEMIHTYPSGKRAIYNQKTGKWEPYNG